jgi:hypothetical protein
MNIDFGHVLSDEEYNLSCVFKMLTIEDVNPQLYRAYWVFAVIYCC